MTGPRHVDGPVLRIAMWSGPRTISTTLLRAWGSRDDTVVGDEPLYLEAVTALGHRPPVLDASDVLAAPEPMLRELCRRLGVPFSDRMLSWPSGSRDSDGRLPPPLRAAAPAGHPHRRQER
ncbi:MAG: hypothetical protein M3387_00945 [Actinomycetota bacterium]|nr:hypothetical protein [Actinomycetota bacterium]